MMSHWLPCPGRKFPGRSAFRLGAVTTLLLKLPPAPARRLPLQFVFWGNGSWSASARGNSVKGHQSGTNYVRFASDGAVVTWTLPYLTIKGE